MDFTLSGNRLDSMLNICQVVEKCSFATTSVTNQKNINIVAGFPTVSDGNLMQPRTGTFFEGLAVFEFLSYDNRSGKSIKKHFSRRM